MSETTVAVVLAAMLMTFVLGLTGLLVFWQLVKTQRREGQPPGSRLNWWRFVVGVATIVSAVLAVATYVRV